MIWYHGTTKENADKILKSEFKTGTYFAKDLDSAIFFGGDYVFFVWFNEDPVDYWEYVCGEIIPTSQIRELVNFNTELLYHNKECERHIKEELFKNEYIKGVKICNKCAGCGQLEYYPPLTKWRDMKEITICEDCGGHGVICPVGLNVYDCKRNNE